MATAVLPEGDGGDGAAVDHLAELLRDYEQVHGRRLWLSIVPRRDSWDLLTRVALDGLGADWLAVKDKRGQTLVISDCQTYAECPNTARHLPSRRRGWCGSGASFTRRKHSS